MESDKYPTCPLDEAGFYIATFVELPTVIIGPDGKCICTIDQTCRNVDRRDGQRCTLAELKQLDREAISRRAWQSGRD